LNVLYIRDGRAEVRGVGNGQPFFYRGITPRVLYRLRLGEASLVTAEPDAVARLRRSRSDVTIETIRVAT
jgi:hypothetical protein